MNIEHELDDIIALASEVLGGLDNARSWLFTPNVIFGWKKPSEYPDYQEVIEILERIGEGVIG